MSDGSAAVCDRLRRYYELEHERGASTMRATVRLPVELVRYGRRRLGPGDQIDGYGRHDLPLLASYSRSGTNWVRFVVEDISGRPTPGQVRLHNGTDYVVDRAHRAWPVMPHHERVVLLLRDYRECLLRHNGWLWRRLDGDVVAFLESDEPLQGCDWYVRNLARFDEHDGQRLLLHYEELVTAPTTAIPRLTAFLGLPEDATAGFLARLEERRSASVDAYRRGGHASVTAGAEDLRAHTRRNLTVYEAAAFDGYYQDRYPQLWDRYLQRYAVDISTA